MVRLPEWLCKLERTCQMADGHVISNRKHFGVIASTTLSTSVMDFVVSPSTIFKSRSQVCSVKVAEIKLEFIHSSEDDYFVIHWDGKFEAEFINIPSDRIAVTVTSINKDTKMEKLLIIKQWCQSSEHCNECCWWLVALW